MDRELLTLVASILGPALLALIGFLLRHLLSSLHKEMKALRTDMERSYGQTNGQLTAMQNDLRANTVSVIQAAAELKAVWRFIDRSHQRASDNGGVDG